MADDPLRDLVASSAGRPVGDVPMQRILGLAHRRRMNRRLTYAAVPLTVLLLAGVAVLATMPQARVELAPADEPETGEETPPDEPAPTTPPARQTPTPQATPGTPTGEPEADPTPTATPTTEDEPAGIAPPEAMVVTDGQEIALRDTVTQAPAWSVAAAGDGEEVVAVSVRPGSTAEDLDLVYTVQGPEGFALGWLAVDGGGEPALRRGVEGAATVTDDVAPGSEPWPVWSPDGEALAWVELPADETAPGVRLRVAEWDGEARVAVDAAALDLEELPLQVIRTETWTEPHEPETEAEQILYLSSWTLEAWRVGLVRGEDGWEVSTPGVLLTAVDALDAGMPVAVGRDDGPGAAYFLAAADGDGEGDVRLALVDAAGHQGLPLDPALETANPAAVWLAGGGHHVLVGDGERAWVTGRPEGLRAPVDGPVRHADWVR